MRPRSAALALFAVLALASLAALAAGGGRAEGGGPFEAGERAAVDTAGDTCLNLRGAPALAAPIAACLPEGTGLTARGERAEADGYVWEAVDAGPNLGGPNLGGWVASGFLARLDPPPAAAWPLASPPPERGMALAAWPGGSVEGLAGASAAAGGCALRSAWANGPSGGGIVRYRFGASDAANRAFLDRHEDASPPAGEPLLLACASEAPPPPPAAPPAARYDRLDPTGEVAAAGAYAFLDADGEPIATWEGLRRAAAALLLYRTGAGGEPPGSEAASGGVVEWRAGGDCWARYLVTAHASPLRFGVEPLGWAAAGCAGAIAADAVAALSWNPPALVAGELASPARHGPWLLIPTDWEGADPEPDALRRAGEAIEPRSGASPPGEDAAAPDAGPFETSDAAEARERIALWRDPAGLPEDWTLALAEAGTRNAPDGYRAIWNDAAGGTALRIEVQRIAAQPDYVWAARGGDGSAATEARVADGRPALVRYSPPGPAHDPRLSVFVRLFDAAADLECSVRGYAAPLRGGDPEAAIAIARSLCPPPAPVLRYGAAGGVAAPGGYAFLEDASDLTSVAHIEDAIFGLGLHGLLIHRTDAGGLSRAAFYDAVAAGDEFTWRHGERCWAHYRVTAVLPNPPSRSLFAVEHVTEEQEGCANLSHGAAVEFRWGPPPALEMGADGIPIMRRGQPVEGGRTYRIGHSRIVIDAPAGKRIAYTGWALNDYPSFDPDLRTLTLMDVATGSLLGVGAVTGARHGSTLRGEAARSASRASEVTALFDAIIASARPDMGDGIPWLLPDRTVEGGRAYRILPDFVIDVPAGMRLAHGGWITGERTHSVKLEDEASGSLLFLGLSVELGDGETGRRITESGAARNVGALFDLIAASARTGEGEAVLRYDRRDTTGGAAAPGSYAFLRNAGDLTGGDAGSAWLSIFGEGLLVHQTDAGGVSRSDFYSEVEAGDGFTAWVAADCWAHYEVTTVLADPPAPPRKRFAVESVTYVDQGCGDTAEVVTAIEFRWGPPPPLELGADGIPVMRVGQPVEGGTYRLERERSFVIDVPVGMRLTFAWTILSDPFPGEEEVVLRDEESGSLLFLAAETGADFGRRIAPGSRPDVSAAFDLIAASARPDARIDGIPWLHRGRPAEGGHAYRVSSSLVIDVPAGMTIVHRGWTRDDWTVSATLEDEASGSLLLMGGGETGRRITESGAARNVGALFDLIAASARTGEGEAVLRYDHRDTTGGAAAPGSYAFLEDASDLASGEGDEGWVPGPGYDKTLLVHQTDASGVSRSGFYSEVKVGDEFTLWLSKDCWGHFEVTAVLADPPAPPRKRFDFQSVTSASHGCSSGTIEADAAIEFRWGPPPPLELGADGVPWARRGHPLEGESAYRVSSSLVVDVPSGMTIVYRGWARNDNGTVTARLEDEESGSFLLVDGFTGGETGRRITESGAARNVGALFDLIAASARTGEGEAVLRYDRRDTAGGAAAPGSYAFLRNASDLTSGHSGTGWLRGYAEGLLAHRADADGVLRSGFYERSRPATSSPSGSPRIAGATTR